MQSKILDKEAQSASLPNVLKDGEEYGIFYTQLMTPVHREQDLSYFRLVASVLTKESRKNSLTLFKTIDRLNAYQLFRCDPRYGIAQVRLAKKALQDAYAYRPDSLGTAPDVVLRNPLKFQANMIFFVERRDFRCANPEFALNPIVQEEALVPTTKPQFAGAFSYCNALNGVMLESGVWKNKLGGVSY